MSSDGEPAEAQHGTGETPAGDAAANGEIAAPFTWDAVEPPHLPQRYRLRGEEGERYIGCDEAPRMQVRVRREYSFSLDRARALGGRVILLDGAGAFGPLVDNKAKLFNLDHHEGCERTFTLATCEQALLLVQSGLDLTEGDWTVYANEPDLDTILAIWCLLNYERLRDLRPESREILFPLLRLEGAIDANGPELAQFCGLPGEALDRARTRIDGLMSRELDSKKRGEWRSLDFEQFTLDVLTDVDRLVYSIEDFREYASIDEVYGYGEIDDRQVAVVCRDAAGVYAVEGLLKSRWGDQLALIALENQPRHYTLRRTSNLATFDLRDAYQLLNLLDPAVDGRPPEKRWGGSSSIGGSPRHSGSDLAPAELLRILKQAFQPRPRRRAWIDAARATTWTAAIGTAALAAGFAWGLLPGVIEPLRETLAPIATSALVAIVAAVALTYVLSGRRAWLFGFRRPASAQGAGWLAALAFVAVLGAVPARAWFPWDLPLDRTLLAAGFGAAVLAAIAVECWFRGLVHGLLLFDGRVQSPQGPWRISTATAVSAILYAALALALSLLPIALSPAPRLAWTTEVALVAGASLVAGLALGTLRERTLSIWPGAAVQVVAAVANFAYWTFWASLMA